MNLLSYDDVAARFAGKTVAVVGSGPSCLDNVAKHIDGHDLVVRINNYKTREYAARTGVRTDVFYSFFGGSIRKESKELIDDGVKFCMAKCPDSEPMPPSPWHKARGAIHGTDFRLIYRRRAGWWPTPVYVPNDERFLSYVKLMRGHIPTTGFSCLLDVFGFECKSIYVTGFDGFQSRKHNVDQPWRPKNPDDPYRHRPDLELDYLRENTPEHVRFDKTLRRIIGR